MFPLNIFLLSDGMRALPSIDSIGAFSNFQLFAFQLIPIYPFLLRELI